MNREIILSKVKIQYDLQYKNVKKINLRIKPDGTVYVSANRRVPYSVIEGFMLSKADFILSALEEYRNKRETPLKQYFTEKEIIDEIIGFCRQVYPYYEKLGINYPQVKFRKMVSRWGSCNPSKGILTFNVNLMYAPPECVKYVVWHEFTHFLQANHSEKFYAELSKVCPNWKERRAILKQIYLPGKNTDK